MVNQKGNRIIVDALIENNVKFIFGICGTSVAGFLSALSTAESIRYIIARHERGAGSMADGFARVTGEVGVCQMHSGAGTLNGILSIVDAYRDSSPVVLLAGQVARKYIGREIFGEAKQFEVLKAYTKVQLRLDSLENIPHIIGTAFSIARSGRPGPVIVEMPEDLYLEEGEAQSFTPSPPQPPALSTAEIVEAVKRITQAARPLILAGGGVLSAKAWALLQTLAEKLQIPVATTQNGRGVLPETHPLALGVCGWYGGNEVADKALEAADVILAIGCSLSSLTTYLFTSPIQGEIIHINIDPSVIGRNLPCNMGIVGDAYAVLTEMNQVLKPQKPRDSTSPWIEKLLRRKHKWERTLKTGTSSDSIPIQPQRLLADIGKVMPDDTIVVTGAGLHHLFVVNYLKVVQPRTFLASVNLGSMGFAFPAAIGAKLAKPTQPVVCFIGDGDFMMSIQELATAVEYGVNLIVVIMNNEGYYAPKTFQKMTFGTEFGSDYSNPDFAAIAKDFGAKGWHIERPTELTDIFKRALDCEYPVVLDVKIDPSVIPPVNYKASFRLRGLNTPK
ncbi:MAG: thiamine pyrophosphate-binding protein [Candidatus Helarchaeota archaeon]